MKNKVKIRLIQQLSVINSHTYSPVELQTISISPGVNQFLEVVCSHPVIPVAIVYPVNCSIVLSVKMSAYRGIFLR